MPAQRLNLQVGEEVDFYRAPGQKNTPGWSGPAKVVDVSRVTRGVVTLRWHNRVIEAQIPNARRHMHFFSLLTVQDDREHVFPTNQGNVWSRIRLAVESLSPGGSIHVVYHRTQDGLSWTLTSANVRYPELFGAIQYFATNQLQLPNVVSARIGIGLRELPSAKGYTSSTVLLWRPGSTYARITELGLEPLSRKIESQP